ncbi:MAG TPA: hypothetical protein VKP68_17855, partial [Ramlibacter sp.]|nr:hypothetical protein [Ramlibacter sp.]
GGVVLIGMGLTFVLVALLASQGWAWIVGAIILIIGVFVASPLQPWSSFVLPAALILGGLLLILQFARKR